MIIANKHRNTRIWEHPELSDIIAEAQFKKDGSHGCNNEITHIVTLQRFEGKPYGYYMIIPNAISDNKNYGKRRFWLRLFASEQVEVIEMPETLE